jgi:uncharacterized membrane protein HdeD (DUF308 family)
MEPEIIDIDTLAHNWWAVLLRGIAAVLFGIIAFVAPGISVVALIALFGAYAFADGLLSLVSAIRRRTASAPWGALVLHGLVGVAAGIVTFVWPGLTAIALLYLIAFWSLAAGVLQIVAAIRLRKSIEGEWLLALSGLASMALGVLVVMFPGPGALTLVWWVGAYALVLGVLLIGLSIRLNSWRRTHQTAAGPSHPVAAR